jgi:hypothetical protein
VLSDLKPEVIGVAPNSNLIVDALLAVPKSEAADFLFAHLQHTRFAAPRAGEYLRHAALHIAPARLPEIVATVEKLGDVPLAQRLAVADGLAEAARKRGLKLPENAGAWLQRVLSEALSNTGRAERLRSMR